MAHEILWIIIINLHARATMYLCILSFCENGPVMISHVSYLKIFWIVFFPVIQMKDNLFLVPSENPAFGICQ